MLVSGAQQRDSVTHTRVSVLDKGFQQRSATPTSEHLAAWVPCLPDSGKLASQLEVHGFRGSRI